MNRMKKTILTMLATIGIVLFLPMTAFAAPTATIVTGHVTDSAHKPVAGATVSVICNGITKADTTDATGLYEVQFTPVECPSGKIAQVVASKGGENGVNSGTIQPPHNTTTINIGVVDVKITPTPELGAVAAAAAALLGGGAFTVVRRRAQQS